MCDKAVDDFLPELKIFPDWFVTSKITKKLLMMIIYSISMEILVMLYFLVMKLLFLVSIFLVSILLIMLILIMMKVILKLLFISYFWLGVLNLKNLKHLKKS